MPNILDANGLQVKTRAELIAEKTLSYQTIYGPDIILTSDSPDGQKMLEEVQSILDIQDLLVQVYNSMDPDNALGVVLDQRLAFNGVQRQAGTFTITDITVDNTESVNLYGLDQEIQDVFTVQDNVGNKWKLVATQLGLVAGSHVLSFRAALPGAQISVPNTITVPVTIVLGVSAINNPTTYTTLGINEESDAKAKIRRQRSVSISSQGFLAGLLAALENISGVSGAFVYENNTDATDADLIPEHSIWVIVGGSAENSDIARAIYLKRNAGAGMKGAVTFTITQLDGSPFVVRWDVVTSQDLFIQFDAKSINGIDPIDDVGIKDYLVANLLPGVYARVDINHLATLVQTFDPNCLVTNAGFADNGGGPFTDTLLPDGKNKQFTLDAANIDITVI